MKKAAVERNIALLLFVLVLLVFSMAQKESRKIQGLYTSGASIQPRSEPSAQQAFPLHPVRFAH